MSTTNGQSQAYSSEENIQVTPNIDLVGGPFAVIESDPGVFTTLLRKIGITGVQVEEVYDIEPYALDHLRPKGLILCFTWKDDNHHPNDFLDPAAKDVWFANQLNDDACASLAILNVLFNCPEVQLGDKLADFKLETMDMGPKMRGLAISNLNLLRDAQNSLARPADVRGAINAVAEATKEATASNKRKASKKRAKFSSSSTSKPKATLRTKKKQLIDDVPDSYHFIGYVPSSGKVWELDGLKSGPLEVGELPSLSSTQGWEDVVRPALRLKMEKYGGDTNGNIQFNLLALVQDRYEATSDELELLKRERATIERRMQNEYDVDWRQKIDSIFIDNLDDVFSTSVQPVTLGPVFAKNFGARKMEKDIAILNKPVDQLPQAWEECAASAAQVKIAVEEEIKSALQIQTDAIKRTHDYEPFIREFIKELHRGGLLEGLLYQF